MMFKASGSRKSSILSCCLLSFLCFSFVGCSTSRQDAVYRIEITGSSDVQLAGEYELDGSTKTISGSLPLEINEKGRNIAFNLHSVKGDDLFKVAVNVDGQVYCSGTSRTAIEGNANAMTARIKCKSRQPNIEVD